MVKCSFCEKEVTPGTGILFALSTGKTFNFCSSKCERNLLKLKRDPRKFKWASSAKKAKKKETAESKKA